MDSRTKKILKLLTLLISSLVIATVSANTYNMFMYSTVGVKTTTMSFVADNPDFTTCGGSITDGNQKVTFSTMNGVAGQEAIYTPVKINNNDTTAGHNITLVLDSWTGASEAHLYNITVTMYNGTGAQKGNSIVLVPSEGTGISVTTSGAPVTIGPTQTWTVVWTVYWKGSAVAGTDSVQVELLLVISS
jgi:hypothetical protein